MFRSVALTREDGLAQRKKMARRNFATGLQQFFYNFAMSTIAYMCDASHKI